MRKSIFVFAWILLFFGDSVSAFCEQASACVETNHFVDEKGTSLSRIARQVYEGQEKSWPLIAKRNKLKAPYKIYYWETVLIIPCVSTSPTREANPEPPAVQANPPITGDLSTAPLKQQEQARPVEVVLAEPPTVVPEPAMTSLDREQFFNWNALGLGDTFVPATSASASMVTPKPVSEIRIASTQSIPSAKAVPQAATPKSTPEKTIRGVYEVKVSIPTSLARANGVVPGTFPAFYLESQKKDGEWGKRQKMVVTISEVAGGYSCHLFLRSAPAKNSAVDIDLENGSSLGIPSDLLKGSTSQAVIPKTPKAKRYNALAAQDRLKAPLALAIVRFALPTIVRGGLGFATTGPIGLAMAPLSLVENLAIRKLAGNERTLAAVQHPSLHIDYLLADQDEKLGAQDTRIRTLELEIQNLHKQMDSLRQTTTATTTVQDKRRK